MSVKTRGYAHRIDIQAPPMRVWTALIEPALLSRWFGPNTSVKARPGGSFVGTLDPGIDREALIDVFEPGRRLRLVYMTPPGMPAFEGALVDDFLIEPDAGHCIVRLLGSGVPEGRLWDAYYLKLRTSSERALARMKLLLERKVAPPQTAATQGSK